MEAPHDDPGAVVKSVLAQWRTSAGTAVADAPTWVVYRAAGVAELEEIAAELAEPASGPEPASGR